MDVSGETEDCCITTLASACCARYVCIVFGSAYTSTQYISIYFCTLSLCLYSTSDVSPQRAMSLTCASSFDEQCSLASRICFFANNRLCGARSAACGRRATTVLIRRYLRRQSNKASKPTAWRRRAVHLTTNSRLFSSRLAHDKWP